MLLKSSLITLLGVAVTALQLNIYSDANCGSYIGTYYPGKCDPIAIEGGIGSWLIVCKNNFDDNCEAIEFFSHNNNGCAGQYGVTALQCSCNADPTVNDNGRCQKTYGLGVHYWGLRDVTSPYLPKDRREIAASNETGDGEESK